MMIVIDNYDSFTYNLVQYLAELQVELKVFRNDQIRVDEVKQLKPSRLMISPGPCSPAEAGVSCDIIREMGSFIPLLGVCLGHQCIGAVYGGKVVRAERLMHGKVSRIHHDGSRLFAGLSNPFEATRYHSLIVEKSSMPDCLTTTAWAREDEIMGLQHNEYPVWGVQFHPESILTVEGKALLKNFLEMTS